MYKHTSRRGRTLAVTRSDNTIFLHRQSSPGEAPANQSLVVHTIEQEFSHAALLKEALSERASLPAGFTKVALDLSKYDIALQRDDADPELNF